MALHQKKEVANQILDCVFASKDLSVALPKYKFPEHETVPDVAYQGDTRRAPARRQLAPESGHVLPDLGGAPGPCADGPLDGQEPRGQG